jgi:hypothetical protein
MKKLFVVLVSICLLSCNDNNEPLNYQSVGTRNGVAHLSTVIYDSCEYIYDSNLKLSVPAVFTHKGNCKFCAKRKVK